jgi:ADP-L-glycero-D-manno-heptose 6-epimerase
MLKLGMRILVTGSEGFIGQNMCQYLKKQGLEVEGYDIKHGQRLPVLNGFSAVIHLGANSSTTEKDLKKVLKENFEISRSLYEICAANDIKFQYASSASVYGKGGNFNEDAFCSPLNPYGFSKYMFDCWLLNQNYPAQGFRYFNVYGKHEDHKGNQASPIHKFTQQAKNNGVIKIFKDSNRMERDFVWVGDVCDAHHRMLYSDASGVFNVGTGKTKTFLDVAEIIAEKHGASIEEIPMPDELHKHYQYLTKADNSKLLDIVGEIEWKTVWEYVNGK